MLKLKEFEKYNAVERKEFVDTIKEYFSEDEEIQAMDIIDGIKKLIDRNIILGPLEVDLYHVVGMKPTAIYYHIAKMFCKGNKQKMKILNDMWDEDTIRRLSTTWIDDWEKNNN